MITAEYKNGEYIYKMDGILVHTGSERCEYGCVLTTPFAKPRFQFVGSYEECMQKAFDVSNVLTEIDERMKFIKGDITYEQYKQNSGKQCRNKDDIKTLSVSDCLREYARHNKQQFLTYRIIFLN